MTFSKGTILIIFLNLFLVLPSFSQETKKYNFKDSQVLSRETEKGSFLNIISKNGKQVDIYIGSDGFCSNLDTISFNNDKIIDYVFAYVYDDSFDIRFLISDNGKYNHFDLGQFLAVSDTCLPNSEYDRYYIKNKTVYVNAFFDSKKKFIDSPCTRKITFSEILTLKKKVSP